MSSYKLTYFPIGGRAEVSRWIFAVAKQPYTDDRIKWEDWPKIKPSKSLTIIETSFPSFSGNSEILIQFLPTWAFSL